MESEWSTFDTVTIGASHLKKEKKCQDSAASGKYGIAAYAVVCDGHGGKDYIRSDRGSAFAVESFQAALKDEQLLAEISDKINTDSAEKTIYKFVDRVISNWNNKVDQDVERFPFGEDELTEVSPEMYSFYKKGEWCRTAYGTTLIGFVVCKDFCFGIQIGDGKCVMLKQNGKYTQPIPWDEMCCRNRTTSLCDPKAICKFRIYIGKELPAAVFAATDGIDNSFESNEKLYEFYDVIMTGLEKMDLQSALQQFAAYLPQLSREGSRDDMAVGMIFHNEAIKKILCNR